MKIRRRTGKSFWPFEARIPLRLFASLPLTFAAFFSGCSNIGSPSSTPFIAQTSPPAKQEFRWTNGKMPKSLDPAKASAAPETDLVRALFEGLTDIDPRSLQEIPAVAEKWTSSDDNKTWRFVLRADAKWSNGRSVTAHDFVRSWTRAAAMGEQAPHRELLNNIRGMRELMTARPASAIDIPAIAAPRENESSSSTTTEPTRDDMIPDLGPPPPPIGSGNTNPVKPSPSPESALGMVAENDTTLKISLILPDKDLPKLVASPIFRPTAGEIPASVAAGADLVTNGAFRLSTVGADGITLTRSENYWDRQSVTLERVRFVPKESAERALEAYRSGEVDAVTNADFEPLALKLLSPFDDFRQTTHSGVNFYQINYDREPFKDRRVRQALAVAIEREVLTDGELESSTRPALTFLPFGRKNATKLSQDRDLARQLLEDAGFPDGLNFPVIRLVVNRNDTQQRIARLVARMWKRNLNLDTEIIVKTLPEMEAIRLSGDYDIIRRGVVLPSNDEAMSLLSIFGNGSEFAPPAANMPASASDKESGPNASGDTDISSPANMPAPAILTEDAALSELRAIPLYFPTSYSLVKPYVVGFEMNGLDAPSLKRVSIDNNWQPK